MGSSQSKSWYRGWNHYSNSSNIYTDKAHHHHQQQQRRGKNFDFRDLILVACGTFFGTLAFLLLLSMIYYHSSFSLPSSPLSPLRKKEFLPNLPFNTIKIWNQQDQYVTDANWMQHWDALLGHDIGFVQVSHPAQFGLRGGYPLRGSVVLDERGKRVERQPGEEAEAYCLSVMHQIHCLIMLKQSFSSSTPVNLTSKEGKHLNHCFDYLRQAVMCSADMSLEKARIDEQGKIELAVDGWGVEHKCRSWDAVETFATKHGFRTGVGGWKLEGQALD